AGGHEHPEALRLGAQLQGQGGRPPRPGAGAPAGLPPGQLRLPGHVRDRADAGLAGHLRHLRAAGPRAGGRAGLH
ncbi:unnamed protein product, partial [Heterosigma akashiwo]